jgi:hypothetical protein
MSQRDSSNLEGLSVDHLETCVCGCKDLSKIQGRSLEFYLPEGHVASNMMLCPLCGTINRDIDPSSEQLRSHFDVASYTRDSNEPHARDARLPFFRWLIEIFEGTRGTGTIRNGRFLDVGSAYGHLLEAIRNAGGYADAVETVARLREQIQSRGFSAYSTLDDVITATPPLPTRESS